MKSSANSRRGAFPLTRIIPAETEFPLSLKAACMEVPLSVIGEPGLLNLPALALFCSVKCPGSIVLKTYEAMQRLKLQDRVIAGGFHSPMERTCLDILLRGKAKLIICPARGIMRLRVRQEWRGLLTEDRLVIVSPFEDGVRRSTIQLASARNRFVGALAHSLLVPYAARRSRTEQFVLEMLSSGKIIYTLPDPESQRLLDLGALPLPL